MTDIKSLLDQKAELDKLIDKQYKEEASKALLDVIATIKKYNFTAQQCFPLPGAELNKKKKVPDKYYDPNTGKSWSGKGRMPKWLEGQNLSEFEIRPEPERTLQTDPRNPFPIA